MGVLTTLYSFCAQSNCTDGAAPSGALVQASDGNYYGVTSSGGTSNACSGGCGTVFRMAAGTVTTLHSFDGSDGADPNARLIQGTDGNLYGVTRIGGANNAGTIFTASLAGNLATLYSFCAQTNCVDGSVPWAALFQSTSGTFYGVTVGGGIYGDGTIFSLDLELTPFVETVPTTGKLGKPVIILGTNLSGATSVTFNSTPATFTVQSPTAIKTTVPAGATTGPVQVVTPTGMLTSNVSFQVLP